MIGRRTLILSALSLAGFAPAMGQVSPGVPSEVWYARNAADSILATPDSGVSLEAFADDLVTGVYLKGTYRGQAESVAYGSDTVGRRYIWFSVGRGESLQYVAMLYDIDRDLSPEFLLFRTIDQEARGEFLVEYRTAEAAQSGIDITVQAACAAPRCDPATWTVHPRERVDVPEPFFDPWRSVFGVAAMRGEPWIGESRSVFQRPTQDP